MIKLPMSLSGSFTKITSITKHEYNGFVYDLSVKDNCSYNINGIIVHNSGCLTASNTGIYMPYFSLLKEINEERKKIDGKWERWMKLSYVSEEV